MAVFALWSAPRARSTAFFRSMAERGDMTVLHEPFCNLRDYGETDAGDRERSIRLCRSLPGCVMRRRA